MTKTNKINDTLNLIKEWDNFSANYLRKCVNRPTCKILNRFVVMYHTRSRGKLFSGHMQVLAKTKKFVRNSFNSNPSNCNRTIDVIDLLEKRVKVWTPSQI